MAEEEYPYVGECAVCGDGLLRLYQCASCDGIVAMCDECELIWIDVALVFESPKVASDGAYPICPLCDSTPDSWEMLSVEDAENGELDSFIAGTSA